MDLSTLPRVQPADPEGHVDRRPATARRSAGSLRRPSTHRSYEQLIRVHILPALGDIRLAKLTAPQVQHFLTACGQKGLSPRTIEYVRAVLRVALNRACKWDLIPRNVVTLTESPRRVRRPVQPLDPVEAKALIASVKGKRLEALFVTALATGMRQGELLGLKWEDIDLGNARLHVRRALQRVDGKLTFVDPKTQQSLRSVRIPKLVVEQLEAHRVRQLEDRLAAGKDWQDSGLVF